MGLLLLLVKGSEGGGGGGGAGAAEGVSAHLVPTGEKIGAIFDGEGGKKTADGFGVSAEIPGVGLASGGAREAAGKLKRG